MDSGSNKIKAVVSCTDYISVIRATECVERLQKQYPTLVTVKTPKYEENRKDYQVEVHGTRDQILTLKQYIRMIEDFMYSAEESLKHEA